MDLIKKRQEAIIDEFNLLDGDLEMSVNYLIELGQELAPIEEENRKDDNLVKGCQSKVWLTVELENGLINYKADANTAITKGLVSLLVRVFNQSSPKDVIDSNIYFPQQIGMDRFIGTQRSNGFAAMIKQMKMYALALNVKENE